MWTFHKVVGVDLGGDGADPREGDRARGEDTNSAGVMRIYTQCARTQCAPEKYAPAQYAQAQFALRVVVHGASMTHSVTHNWSLRGGVKCGPARSLCAAKSNEGGRAVERAVPPCFLRTHRLRTAFAHRFLRTRCRQRKGALGRGRKRKLRAQRKLGRCRRYQRPVLG